MTLRQLQTLAWLLAVTWGCAGPPPPTPQDLCNELTVEWTDYLYRCDPLYSSSGPPTDLDYQATERELVGTCVGADVSRFRDVAELRDECIPRLADLECDAPVPSACVGQVL